MDEKQISELELLRDDVEDILPARFDPAQAIADPAPLSARAATTVGYYRASTRMEGDFVRLRRVCPVLLAALAVLEVATALLTTYYAKLLDWSAVRVSGLLLAAVAVLIMVTTTGAYVALQHRLASAEILAGTGGRTDQERA